MPRRPMALLLMVSPLVAAGPGVGVVDGPEAAGPGPAERKPEDAVQGPGDAGRDAPAVPYPHPMISEVLFAVPTGEAGDASGDGKRDVAGDEFVEIVNPHGKPIQLLGYTLTDSNEPNKGQLKFRFPALELAAGAVVVVFNGHATVISGPVGTTKAPASGGNPAYGGARVFSMHAASSRQAFNNSSDYVLLSAPDKTKVHRVAWGPAAKAGLGKTGAGDGGAIVLADTAPDMVRGSVQREGVGELDSFVQHDRIDPERLFSPGVFGEVEDGAVKAEHEAEAVPEPAAVPAPGSEDQTPLAPKRPT